VSPRASGRASGQPSPRVWALAQSAPPSAIAIVSISLAASPGAIASRASRAGPCADGAGRRSKPCATLHSLASEDAGMWVIYLEALGVLVMVLALVWWTMRGKR
jgi:hypothetical protein